MSFFIESSRSSPPIQRTTEVNANWINYHLSLASSSSSFPFNIANCGRRSRTQSSPFRTECYQKRHWRASVWMIRGFYWANIWIHLTGCSCSCERLWLKNRVPAKDHWSLNSKYWRGGSRANIDRAQEYGGKGKYRTWSPNKRRGSRTQIKAQRGHKWSITINIRLFIEGRTKEGHR